ncbi:MAG: histidine kinase dimerization/phosphoacceptor domain -containing protein [Syntrophotaleaceae bacterium]
MQDLEKGFCENIFQNAPMGIFRSTLDGRFVRANPAMAAIFKYDSPEELIGHVNKSGIAEVLYEEPARREEILREILQDREWKTFIERMRCRDGRVIPCYLHLRSVPTKNQGVELEGFVEDDTARTVTEKRLHESLVEKELLLKEIHHRIKNSLQVISSLLYLQSRKISDPEIVQHFVESQNRIYSMALAHELLYRNEKLSDVQLPDYVRNLVQRIEQALKPKEKQVNCRVSVVEIPMDIQQVIPCGLLITELVSNALKHGFPGDRSGTVNVSLLHRDDRFCLEVRDDGIGLPQDLDLDKPNSLGMQLVRALTLQLDGTLEQVRGNGTLIKVVFPVLYSKGSVRL